MKNYLVQNKINLSTICVVSACLSATFSEANRNTIRTVPLKDLKTLNILIKKAGEAAPKNSKVEEDQVTNITYNDDHIYIVPVKSNSGNKRGCYIYSFDRN
jgi:hypothetical protein